MKKSKAAGVSKLLKQGYSAREIKDRMAVSESYIYFVKKQMAAEKAAAKAAKTTKLSVDSDLSFTPEEVGASEEVFIEAALAASQGKGKPKSGEFIQADTNVDAILNARADSYGPFIRQAMIAQMFKATVTTHLQVTNKTIMSDQAEALDLIFTKIGRILNGDPDYVDSWTDIAGYATLVADRLQGKIR